MTATLEINEATIYMKPGWVAFDKKNKRWCWYKHKPHCAERLGLWMRDEIEHPWCDLSCMSIREPADWTKSLMKTGE